MEYWKFVILTYISVALIEGIPTGNDLYDKKPINMVKMSVYDQNEALYDDLSPRAGPIANYFLNRRTSTLIPQVITTVSPGSLADLNLKIDAVKNQLTALNNQVVAEELKIQDLTIQMQDINSALTVLTSLIGGGNAG